MSFTSAQHALIRRLQTMPGRPALVYPNAGNTAPLPRIVVQVSAQTGRTASLGGATDAMTEIVAMAEAAEGDGAPDGIVQAIVDRFPVGLRFDGLTIEQAPQPRPQFQGDGYFSVPVVIRARHFF